MSRRTRAPEGSTISSLVRLRRCGTHARAWKDDLEASRPADCLPVSCELERISSRQVCEVLLLGLAMPEHYSWIRRPCDGIPKMCRAACYPAVVERVKDGFPCGGRAWPVEWQRLLQAHGFCDPEIISRDAKWHRSGRRAALAARGGAAAATLEKARLDCDVAVAGRAGRSGKIESVAGMWRRRMRRRAGNASLRPQAQRPHVALHASGALSSDALAALAACGVETGSAHPMMTFVAGEPPSLEAYGLPWKERPAAVRRRVRWRGRWERGALRLSREKGAVPRVRGDAFADAGYRTEAAERIGLRAGIDAEQVRRIMEPIVLRTVRNVLRTGAGKSFSGPLARGDVRTVERHLESLEGMAEVGCVSRIDGVCDGGAAGEEERGDEKVAPPAKRRIRLLSKTQQSNCGRSQGTGQEQSQCPTQSRREGLNGPPRDNQISSGRNE